MSEVRADLRRAQARIVSMVSALIGALVASLVLVGWAAHSDALTSLGSDRASAKPNSAACILVLAVALVMHAGANGERWSRITQRLLAGSVAVLTGLTLAEYASDHSLGIDTVFVGAERFAGEAYPGRMPVAGAVCLLAVAVAVCMAHRVPLLSQSLAVIAGSVGLITLLAYAYGSGSLNHIGQTGVSAPGAAGLVMISVAVATMVPDRGPMMLLTADGSGGTLLRRLASTVLLLPPILGAVVAAAARNLDFDFNFAAAMIVVALMVIGSAIVWDNARRLQITELERNFAETELASLNAELQSRVDERTASLRQSEQRQRALSQTARDAIILADERGLIVFANPAADQMFGWPDGGLLDRPAADVLPRGLDSRSPANRHPAIHDEDVTTEVVETFGLTRDGAEFPVEASLARWTQDGKSWFAGTIRDLTAQKQADAARQELLDRYQRLADSGTEAVASARGGLIIECNRAFGSMFGCTPDEVLHRPMTDFIDLDAGSPDGAAITGDAQRLIGFHRNGARLIVEVTSADADIALGAARTYTLQDVTASYRRDQLRQARLKVAGVLAADHSWNEAADRIARELCQALGWGLGEMWLVTDRTLTRSAVWCEDDNLTMFASSGEGRDYRIGRGLPGRAWSQGAPAWMPDVRIESRFDRAAAARAAGVTAGIAFPIASRNEILAVGVLYTREHVGDDEELALVLTDIGRQIGDNLTRQRLEAELRGLLEHRASHDALTGLPNRVLFQDRLEHALEVAARSRTTAGLLLLDLDRFKAVNDTYGHQAGDEVLIDVSRRLRGVLRQSDTVARLGGDEFGVLIEGESVTRETIAQVCNKISAAVHEPFTTFAGTASIGVSIGAALLPDEADNAQDAISLADSAMYADKSRPRSTQRPRVWFGWPRHQSNEDRQDLA